MKRVILIGLVLLIAASAIGQTLNVDSLVNVLETKQLTTDEKLLLYSDICYYYLGSDPQKAKLYIQEAISFAEKENSAKYLGGYFGYLGSLYKFEGNYNYAIDAYNKGLNYSIKAKHEPGIAFLYGGIAEIYLMQAQLTIALDYMLKSLSIYEKDESFRSKSQQVNMLNNIGSLHRKMENADLAIDFLKKQK